MSTIFFRAGSQGAGRRRAAARRPTFERLEDRRVLQAGAPHVLASMAAPANCAPGTPTSVGAASARDLGAVSQPASVTQRDGGASALIGGRMLWTFADTGFDAGGGIAGLRPNTAGLADPASPRTVVEPTDSNGVPDQFLPFTPEERRFNETQGSPGRIALWPSGVIAAGDAGVVFYNSVLVKPGFLDYEFLGAGIARVAAGSTTAARDAGFVFETAAPHFVVQAAVVREEAIYLYGSRAIDSTAMVVARAPLASLADRGAYRFWDGTAWMGDVQQARPVLCGVPGALSVSFNPYLGKFLAVHGGDFLAGTQNVFLHVADRPEGPWSAPVLAFTGEVPAQGDVNRTVYEHPELSGDGGRTIVVSYFHPKANGTGEVRLVEVTLLALAPPAPPPLVTIQGVPRVRKARRGAVGAILVSFSGALDPASAERTADYQLVLGGRGRRPIVLAADYDEPTRTVTLVPRGRPIRSLRGARLTLRGGLLDASGRPWDGDGDGQPGGDHTAILR